MYIWLFSRSDGAGSATTRNTRGLTRSVMALIVPPFPAPSRPSITTMMRSPVDFTQSWSWQSRTCSLRNSFSYSLRFIFGLAALLDFCECFMTRLRFGLLLSEAPRADGKQGDRKRDQNRQIRPERAPRRVLQGDSADDGHQITQRVQIRELLEEWRHVLDRGCRS